MVNIEKRQKQILDLLTRDGYESIQTLSEAIGVSHMTIRRDLSRLEDQGLIRRTHGGATAQRLGQIELDYADRLKQKAQAKRQIGHAAAEMVGEGETVFLDAGTTGLAMAEFLAKRKGLTVVTRSLSVVERLAGRDGIELFLLGGEVRRDLMSVVGYRTEEQLASFRLDVAFLGTGGVDLERGLNHSTVEEIPIKKLAANIAQRVVVLADRSKLSEKGQNFYLPLSDIDFLVTEGKGQADVREFGRRASHSKDTTGL